MKKSAKELEAFIKRAYIENPKMGSPNMASAIRDLLTDLLHLGNENNLLIQSRLDSAREVYDEECGEDS